MHARQAALERQDLSCTYLAHHELESVIVIVNIIIIIVTTIITVMIIVMPAGYGAILQDVDAAAASPPGPAQQPQSLSCDSITSGALSNSPEEEEEEGDH